MTGRARAAGAVLGGGVAALAVAVALAGRCGAAAPPPAPAAAAAPAPPAPMRATVIAVTGEVDRRVRGGWVPVRPGDRLSPDDALRTRAGAHADLEVDDLSRLVVTESTELLVRDLTDALHRFRLARGRVAVAYEPHPTRELRLESGDGRAVAHAQAARFSALATGLTFAVATETGTVDLAAAGRTVRVGEGQQSVVAGEAPPRDPMPIPERVLLEVAEQSRLDRPCDRLEARVALGSEVLADGAPADVRVAGDYVVLTRPPGGRPVAVAIRDVVGRTRVRELRCREKRATNVDLRWIDDAPDP